MPEGANKEESLRDPSLLTSMVHLLVGHLENKASPEASQRHFDYILDTCLQEVVPITCSAWLARRHGMETGAQWSGLRNQIQRPSKHTMMTGQGNEGHHQTEELWKNLAN